MDEKTIEKVARVLSDWNPVGAQVAQFPDLEGYRTEAIDILFHLEPTTRARDAERIVRDVLNEAFYLTLTTE